MKHNLRSLFVACVFYAVVLVLAVVGMIAAKAFGTNGFGAVVIAAAAAGYVYSRHILLSQEPPPERWMHMASGGVYEHIGIARRESDRVPVVIYRDADDTRRVLTQPAAEFYDGRFEPLDHECDGEDCLLCDELADSDARASLEAIKC